MYWQLSAILFAACSKKIQEKCRYRTCTAKILHGKRGSSVDATVCIVMDLLDSQLWFNLSYVAWFQWCNLHTNNLWCCSYVTIQYKFAWISLQSVVKFICLLQVGICCIPAGGIKLLMIDWLICLQYPHDDIAECSKIHLFFASWCNRSAIFTRCHYCLAKYSLCCCCCVFVLWGQNL